MKFKISNRLACVILILYWLTIFTLTHLPLDRFLYFLARVQPSDKVLHFVAYLVLGFLLWWAIDGDTKVLWSKPKVWWFLLVVVWYGAFDEWLQSYVGRACDVYDFMADLTGIGASLLVLSFFTSRPAAVILAGILTFSLTNLTKVNLAELFPATDILFYLLSYSIFTLLWIRYISQRFSGNSGLLKRAVSILAVPVAFLLFMKLSSEILHKDFTTGEILLSASGIAVVFVIYLLAGLSATKRAKGNL